VLEPEQQQDDAAGGHFGPRIVDAGRQEIGLRIAQHVDEAGPEKDPGGQGLAPDKKTSALLVPGCTSEHQQTGDQGGYHYDRSSSRLEDRFIHEPAPEFRLPYPISTTLRTCQATAPGRALMNLSGLAQGEEPAG